MKQIKQFLEAGESPTSGFPKTLKNIWCKESFTVFIDLHI